MSDIRSEYTDGLDFYGQTNPFELLAQWGAPLYVYNEKILRQRCRDLVSLSDHSGFRVNYSVKANSNPVLLAIIRSEGLMADAMSPGELYMNELAGYEPANTLYIANNITADEMAAAVAKGCLTSVDSLAQLDILGSLNRGGRAMIRINPGIGAGHSEKVITAGKNTKFGISPDDLDKVFRILQKHDLVLAGINQHIGSLFMEPASYLAAARVLLDLIETLPPEILASLEYIDFGGGFGIPYHKYEHEKRLDLAELGKGLHELVSAFAVKMNYGGKFLIEPGRYVAAECGLLLGSVTSVKENAGIRYAGTDLGFNNLMRPVMYGSFHDLEIYRQEKCPPEKEIPQTIVGNICESGDVLARDRLLPPLRIGDILAVLDAGAYGFSMASNYNERFLPAEVLIRQDGSPRLIRRRQNVRDLAQCLEIS